MKIKSVTISNIHSICGVQSIDFEKINDGNIILISGNTGSGKSSILDAITLALYGKVARYSNGKMNENVININSIHGFSECTFSCESGIYTAKWSIKRNKSNQSFYPAKRQIVNGIGSVILEKSIEIDRFIEQETGLDYDRFCRTIMLQQGRFSQFLESDDKTKGDLLERMTGDFLFSKISMFVFEKYKNLKIQLDQAKESYDAIPSISEQEKKIKKEELEANHRELKKILQDIELDRKKIKLLELKQKNNLLLEKIQDEKTKQIECENEKKIKLYEKYSQIVLSYQTKNQELCDLQQKQIQCKNEIDEIEKEESLLKKKMIDIYSRLLSSINIIHKKNILLENRMLAAENQKITLQKISSNKPSIREEIQNINSMINALSCQLSDIKEKNNLLEKLKNQKIKEKKIVEKINIFIEKKEKQSDKYVELVTEYEEAVENNCIIKILETKKDGDVCPVCGNILRHISIHSPVHNIKEKKQQIEKIKKEIEETKTEIDGYNMDKTVIETEMEMIRQSIESLSVKIGSETEFSIIEKIEQEEHAKEDIELQLKQAEDAELEIVFLDKCCVKAKNTIDEYNYVSTWIDKQIGSIRKLKCLGFVNIKSIETGKEKEGIYSKKQFDSVEISCVDELNLLCNRKSTIQNDIVSIGDKVMLLTKEISSIELQHDGLQDIIQSIISEQDYFQVKAQIETIINERKFYLQEIKNNEHTMEEIAKETGCEEDNLNVDNTLEKQNEKIETLYQKQQSIIEKNAEITSLLNINQKNVEKKNELEISIRTYEKEYFYINKINKLIGSADGRQFSKYVQEMTLLNIIEIANHYMQSVSFRYNLQKTEEGLGISVIDVDASDAIRPVSTLSGGEKFIVSLVLAISLSDIACGKSHIESLFIDEGFGTLDAIELDKVLDVLNRLIDKNKTIAIISHLEELKEKMNSVIYVEKDTNGVSAIRW